jgi:hypothetical protein
MPYVNKPRPYKHEYETYHGKPEQIKNRSERNAARTVMVKKGAVKKGDGKDVDHVKALSKGGANTTGNLRIKSASANRSFSRNADHSLKKNTPQNKNK